MSDGEYMLRVRKMQARLYRIAQAMLWRPADCADAVQEAVFRGWMKRGSLRNPVYFETWLIRILINECKNQLKRRGREALPLTEDISAEECMCENLHLRQALKRLPEKYRLPLLLHHMEGYSVADVAEALSLTPSCVSKRLYKGRRMLRELLDGGEEK